MLSFQVRGRQRRGKFRVRYDAGYERYAVQVVLPGVIATTTRGFLGGPRSRGRFQTEFLPPSYYI